MKDFISCIKFWKFDNFPTNLAPIIDNDNSPFVINSTTSKPLKFLSANLKLVDQAYIQNFIYNYADLQVNAVLKKVKSDQHTQYK